MLEIKNNSALCQEDEQGIAKLEVKTDFFGGGFLFRGDEDQTYDASPNRKKSCPPLEDQVCHKSEHEEDPKVKKIQKCHGVKRAFSHRRLLQHSGSRAAFSFRTPVCCLSSSKEKRSTEACN